MLAQLCESWVSSRIIHPEQKQPRRIQKAMDTTGMGNDWEKDVHALRVRNEQRRLAQAQGAIERAEKELPGAAAALQNAKPGTNEHLDAKVYHRSLTQMHRAAVRERESASNALNQLDAHLSNIKAEQKRVAAAEDAMQKAAPGSHAYQWNERDRAESLKKIEQLKQQAITLTPALPPARLGIARPSMEDFQKAQSEGNQQRLGAYRFAAQVQAYERLKTGSSNMAVAEVMRFPEHEAAFRSGKLPLPYLKRLAELEEKQGDLSSKRAQSAHVLKVAQRPENTPVGAQIPPVRLPAPLSVWQQQNQKADALRQQVIKQVAEGLLAHQWVASSQEALAIATQHYGKLTHEQLAAVAADESQRFIHAGPGTGKTRVAAATALFQMATDQVDPRTIVIASPTHSGKQALIKAISEHTGMLPPSWQEDPEKIEGRASTIHSIAYRALASRDKNNETALEKLGKSGWKLLASGNRSLEDAKSVEEAVQMAGEDRNAYLRKILYNAGAKPQKSYTDLGSYISEVKQNQGNKQAYQSAIDQGEQDWKRGEHSNAALLYLYEQSLQQNKLFDFDDMIHLWSQAGQANNGQGFTPKIRASVFGESQSFTRDMLRGLASNSTRGSRIIFEGDIGQQTTGGAQHFDDLLEKVFSQTGSYLEFQLTGNQRLPKRAAEMAAAIYTDPSVRLHGASPIQISVNGKEGAEETYALGSSFSSAHNQAIDQLFNLMQLSPDQMHTNVKAGLSPFAGAAISAREMPVIFQIVHGAGNERTKFNRSLFKRFEQMGGRNYASRAMQLGVTQQTPGSEKSREDQLHLLSVQQAQSQGFPHPFGSATRGGQWDEAGYKMNLGVMVSRATEQMHWMATSANFQNTPGFINDFEEHPFKPGQLVPRGFAELIERATYMRHAIHGDDLSHLPEELRSYELPMEGERPFVDADQLAALKNFVEDWLEMIEAAPPAQRQVDLSEARGIIQAQPGDFLNYDDETGESRANYFGVHTSKGGTTAVANGEFKNLPDPQLMEYLQDRAALLMENPELQAPENLKKYLDTVKEAIGRVNMNEYEQRGEEYTQEELKEMANPGSMMLKEDEKKRGLDNAHNEFEKKLFGPILPSEYGIEHWLGGSLAPARSEGEEDSPQSRLGNILGNPQFLLENPDVEHALDFSVYKGEDVLRLASGRRLSARQLEVIAPALRKWGEGIEAEDPNDPENLEAVRKMREYYNDMAKGVEALAGPDAEPGASVTLPYEAYETMLYGRWTGARGETNPKDALAIRQVMQSEHTFSKDENGKLKRPLFKMLPDAFKRTTNLAQRTLDAIAGAISNQGIARTYNIGVGESSDAHFMSFLLSAAQGQFLDPHDVVYREGSNVAELRGGHTHLREFYRRLHDLYKQGSYDDSDTREHLREQLRDVSQVEQAFNNNYTLSRYGHYLNQVYQIATGRSPFAENGRYKNQFFSAFREQGKYGGRTFEDIQELQQALSVGSRDVDRRGVMNRGNINRVIEALGMDPEDPELLGLRKLDQLGFDTADKELPLMSFSGEKNLVDLLAPDQEKYRRRRAELMTVLSRTPAHFGERYTIGKGPGYAKIGDAQEQLGLRPGMEGTLHAWGGSKKGAFGGAVFKGASLAKEFMGRYFPRGLRLFTKSGESAYTTKHVGEQSPMPPLYIFETDDGQMIPVRNDQLTALNQPEDPAAKMLGPEERPERTRTRISKAKALAQANEVYKEIKAKVQARVQRLAAERAKNPPKPKYVPELHSLTTNVAWRGRYQEAWKKNEFAHALHTDPELQRQFAENAFHPALIARDLHPTPAPEFSAQGLDAAQLPGPQRVKGPSFKAGGIQTGFADLDQLLSSMNLSTVGIRRARDAAKAFVGQSNLSQQELFARHQALDALKDIPMGDKKRRALEQIQTVFGQATGIASLKDFYQSGVLAPSLAEGPKKAGVLAPSMLTEEERVAPPPTPASPDISPEAPVASKHKAGVLAPPVDQMSQTAAGGGGIKLPPPPPAVSGSPSEPEQSPLSSAFDAFLSPLDLTQISPSEAHNLTNTFIKNQNPSDEDLHLLYQLAGKKRGSGDEDDPREMALRSIQSSFRAATGHAVNLEDFGPPENIKPFKRKRYSKKPATGTKNVESIERQPVPPVFYGPSSEAAERVHAQSPYAAPEDRMVFSSGVPEAVPSSSNLPPPPGPEEGGLRLPSSNNEDLDNFLRGEPWNVTARDQREAMAKQFLADGGGVRFPVEERKRMMEHLQQFAEDIEQGKISAGNMGQRLQVSSYLRDMRQHIRGSLPLEEQKLPPIPASAAEGSGDGGETPPPTSIAPEPEELPTSPSAGVFLSPPPPMEEEEGPRPFPTTGDPGLDELLRSLPPGVGEGNRAETQLATHEATYQMLRKGDYTHDQRHAMIGRLMGMQPHGQAQQNTLDEVTEHIHESIPVMKWGEYSRGKWKQIDDAFFDPNRFGDDEPVSPGAVLSREEMAQRYAQGIHPGQDHTAPPEQLTQEQRRAFGAFLRGLNRPGVAEKRAQKTAAAWIEQQNLAPHQVVAHHELLQKLEAKGTYAASSREAKIMQGVRGAFGQKLADLKAAGLLPSRPQKRYIPEEEMAPLRDYTDMSPAEYHANFKADIADAIMSGEKGSKLFPKPSLEQQEIYQYQGKRLRIRGGPGTAKTAALLNGLLYRAVSGQSEPDQIQLLSYTHSGVDEMAKRINGKGGINERLRGMGDSTFQIQAPKTIYALAHQIITKGSERKGHYPVMNDFERPWTGNIIQELTKEELEELPPEDRANYIPPDEYLRKAITNKGYANPSAKELKDYAQFIKQAKSERSDDNPNNLYNKSLGIGAEDLNNKRMTPEAALSLWEEKLFNRGDIDFQDMPHFASLALDEQGMAAVPKQYRRVNLLGIDEGQDNNRVAMQMVSKYMKALAPNSPALFSAFDPNQALIPRKGGGLEPDLVADEYDRAFGKMDELPLSLNRRSSRGTVLWNNAILSELKERGRATPPLQKATTEALGKYPGISLDPHQAAQYTHMFSDLMIHAKVDLARAKENYLQGLHPLADDEQAQAKLGRSALVFNQHRDADFAMAHFERLLAQGEGPTLTSAQAQEMRKMLFRTKGSKSEGDEETRALVGLPADIRSHAYGYLGQDVSHVGGGAKKDKVSDDWLRSLLIGVSRENEGVVNLYGTNRPFDAEQQQQYLANQNVLQKMVEGGYTFNGESFTQDKRNVPEQFAGRIVPRGLPKIMGRVMDLGLASGIGPDTYFPRYQHQHAENLAALRAGQQNPHDPYANAAKDQTVHLGAGSKVVVNAQTGSTVQLQGMPTNNGPLAPVLNFLDKISNFVGTVAPPGALAPPPPPAGGATTGGSGATTGGSNNGSGSGGGGNNPNRNPYNNAPAYFGRTLARISDELSYVGQNMQKAADDAIQEGSAYRHASLAIPLAPGATVDPYGNSVAALSNPQKAATQITKGPWYDQLGQVLGSGLVSAVSNTPGVPAYFGDAINLVQDIGKNQGNIGGYFSDLGVAFQQQNQKALSFWGDIGKNGWNIGQDFGDLWNHLLGGSPSPGQAAPGPKKQAKGTAQSAGGPSGTQGFFDFTDVDNPNTIGYLQANVLPMYSDTQIMQALQQYFGATNTYFSKQGVNAATNDMALAAMANMDPSQLIGQMTGITGYTVAGSGNKNPGQAQAFANNQLAGIVLNMFKGNLSEQNVQPFMDYMSSTVGNIAGENPLWAQQPFYTPTPSLASAQSLNASPQVQAATVAQMAMNAGYSASDLSTTAGMVNSLVGVGMGPDLRQQYALSQLYGAQNMTASPQLVQFNQQQLGNQMQLANLQLQQKMQIPQVQMEIASAQISLDKVNFEQAQFSLAQNTAQFNQQQYMNNQQYGPIGADVSREAYFNFQRSQLAAGYDPTSPNNAVNYKPSQPFGLKNEEFYAGIENQRSQLVLGRSKLLADAQFQQQMKYLNEQENFYVREIDLQNQQRAFDKTWGEQSLAMQAKALDAQAKMLPLQISMAAYQQQQAAIQQQYLPQQVALQQQLNDNLSQWIKGEGPVKGGNPSVTSILQKLESSYLNDKGSAAQKGQDLQKLIQQLDLPADQQAQLFNIIVNAANSHQSVAQIMNQLQHMGAGNLIQQLQQGVSAGAYGSQQENAGNANANLQAGGVGQNWDQLIQTMNQDITATNNLHEAMASTTGLTKRIGDLTSAITPLTTGVSALSNIFSILEGFAGGGAGGARGGAGGGGTIGPSMTASGGATPGAEGDPDGPPGDPRNPAAPFFINLMDAISNEKRKKNHGTSYPHFGITTPNVNTEFMTPMWYGPHEGVDFAAAQGSSLSEFIGGRVKSVGFYPWGGEIDVEIPGGYTERYLHLSQIGVAAGQKVKKGQHIGLTGGGTPQSGYGYWSHGSHLHTQIDEGNINAGVDPWPIWAAFGDRDLIPYIGGVVATSGLNSFTNQSSGNTGLQRGKGNQHGDIGGGGFMAGMAAGGIALSPIVTPLAEKEPEAVVPLSKLSQVMAMVQQQSGHAAASAPVSNGTTVTIQTLVGTMSLNVYTAATTLSDGEKDQLIADAVSVIDTAIQTVMHRV
jgi:superfamily I DNA/RNA helicase/murein DD-endopeptidase MepM/ murein hydrolase activator NlpD